MEQTKKRLSLSTGDRTIAIALAVLVVGMVIMGVLQKFHLCLIQGELSLFLPLLAVILLLGWGVSALVRRIRNHGVKIAVGVVLGLVVALAAMVVFSYVSFVATVSLPHAYKTVTSPSGAHKLVVMRSLDPNEDRMRTRQAARLEAAAEAGGEAAAAEDAAEAGTTTSGEAASEAGAASGDDYTVDDWGYIYTAYPRAARFFYRDDADVQGEAIIGYSSPATLMVEWAADESQARFYVQDPAAADGGEVIVRFGTAADK